MSHVDASLATLQTWTERGLDWFFPPACAGCGRLGHRICPRCAQLVTPAPVSVCQRCGRPQPALSARCPDCADATFPLHRVRAAALHCEPLRHWIHLFKYQGRSDLGAPLARYLVAALDLPDWQSTVNRLDGVVPVPLHPDRLRWRGYNQSEVLARQLCSQRQLSLRTDLLERTRPTRAQIELHPHERSRNVAGAFTAQPASQGLHLLLVDDVYTTGATLNACARALLAAGAAQVDALTLTMPDPLHGVTRHTHTENA